MKAAQYSQYGGPEVIKINDIEVPALKDSQVLVEVYAAGINPFDYRLRAGRSKDVIPLHFPITVGADFSGVVRGVISGVTEYTPGEEVYGSAIILNGGSGAMAEFAAANTKSIAPKPPDITHSQAAALVLVGVSVFQAIDQLGLGTVQKVLIHGGAGGIGSAAIQYAKHLGAYVATTARASDKDFVVGLGADEVIDFETQQFEELLHDYDAVFDTIGGEVYAKSFQILKNGGVIISMVEHPNEELAGKYGVKALMQNSLVNTESLTRLTDLIETGIITPQIDKEYSLGQVVEAFKHAETGHPRGKIVVTMK